MKPTIIAVAVSLAFTTSAQAAQRVYIDQELPHLSKQQRIHANERDFIQAFEQQHRGSSLQKMQSMALDNGKTLMRFQQTYKGVPVWNSSLVKKKERHQALPSLSGFIVADIGNDVKKTIPSLTPNQAAKKALAGQKGKVQQTQLIIYQLPSGKAVLAYLVTFLTHGEKVSRPFVVINAHTGKELDRWNGITHAQATGPGGNEKTGQYNYGTDFPSLEVTKEGDTCKTISPNVRTYDLGGSTSGGSIHTFTCPENTFKFVNGAYSPINDAHMFGKVVFDMG